MMIDGFITGDLVRGTETMGINKVDHAGCVAVHSSGQFYIKKQGGKAMDTKV
jgi:hypothetical protein